MFNTEPHSAFDNWDQGILVVRNAECVWHEGEVKAGTTLCILVPLDL